jgi:hypothetical protein
MMKRTSVTWEIKFCWLKPDRSVKRNVGASRKSLNGPLDQWMGYGRWKGVLKNHALRSTFHIPVRA